MTLTLDPTRDLVLDRLLKAPPAKVWRLWTEPALICQWFCPKPWSVSEAVIDLRPGGRFFTRMAGPNGESVSNEGSFLEVVAERKLVFTDMFGPDFAPLDVPQSGSGLQFAAIVTLEPEGTGTRYQAIARHRSAADAKTHEEMGFHIGWGIAADQLDDLAARI